TTDITEEKKFIAIPYIKGLSELVSKSLKNIAFDIGYKCFNRLNKFIKVHKENSHNNNNIIYQIQCKDCDATYVGQTKRQLKTLIKEHKYNFYQSNAKFTVTSKHILDKNHTIDWENTKILDNEPHYNHTTPHYKRLIAESIHINKQKNGLNIMEDCDLLDRAY
ncbi:hypothetical protein EAG_06640, partial [Camponotus floridanus]